MPNPNPSEVGDIAEVAQLIVRDQVFEDWESVWVQLRWRAEYNYFRFTAAEYSPIASYWTKSQFKPGDPCQIILGGQQAIQGIILRRQTAYDANSHMVELSGVSREWAANTSSVPTTINNFDNMPLDAIAQKLMSFYGVGYQPIGTIDPTPFDHMQAQPGEKVFDFLDKLARHRGAVLGADSSGNFLLVGQHANPIVQQLIEGQNIKKMQCVFEMNEIASIYSGTGQKPATDGDAMASAANMQAQAAGSLPGMLKFIETVLEQPVKSMAELEMRVTYEALAREGTLIDATATVQGWLRDGVSLWKPGDNVYVYSPMAMLDLPLSIQSVTFSQDNERGTQTEIECVLPWALMDTTYSTDSNNPQPPGGANTTSSVPPAPPPTQSTDPNAPNYVPPPGAFEPGGVLGPGPYP